MPSTADNYSTNSTGSGDVTPDSMGDSAHSEANRTSVAISNALVGELLMESPSPPRRVRRSNHPNRHVISADQLKAMLETQDKAGPTWVERGMNWWQKQKELRQRIYLQQLADEQRRKLHGADADYNHNYVGESNSASHYDEDDSDHDHLDIVRPSKSGSGVTVELDLDNNGDDIDANFWVPEVKIEPEVLKSFPFCPYILNQQQRQSIAVLGLPPSLAYCRWKRLYSLARDGDSFDTFLQHVQGHTHTLLVIKSTRDVMFGGYADTEWKAQHQGNPEFFGSGQAFLFRIDSEQEVRVFKWTGANRYTQYLDYKNSMLAFGGGGDVGAFGLCIEKDFQRGSSGNCATFDNEPLCDDENFEIVDVECYGFLSGTF
ncbi:hypothetical protein MHU86_9720 [Fragilaria crotonensis]|nr:hypothetical protein MHU86_9720 [Fragilaria crotonensis]